MQSHRTLMFSAFTTFQQANSAKTYRFFFGCVQVLDFDQCLAVQSRSKHDATSVRYMVNFTLHRIVSCLKRKTTTYCPVQNKYQGIKAILKLVALTSTHFRAGLIFINFTSLYALFMRDNHQDYAEGCWHSNTYSETLLKILVIILNYVFCLIVKSQSCWPSNIHLALQPQLLLSNVLGNHRPLKLHANQLKGANVNTQAESENRKMHQVSSLRTKLFLVKIKHWFTVTLWKH